MASKIALVTGANGFVGSNLCERLLDAGYHVRALVRPGANVANLEGIDVEIAHGQISDQTSLVAPLAGVDVVFHVAGAVRERKKGDFMRVNRDATAAVAQACVELDQATPRFVHISSLAGAGPAQSHEQPRREVDAPSPMSDYGRSKLAGEEAVRPHADKMSISIVRPPIVYGPKDTDFYDVFKMAKRGVVLKPGFSKKLYSIIHVIDLAEAAILVAEKGQSLSAADPAQGVYFVSDGGLWAWEELGHETARALEKTTRVLPLPASLTYVVASFAILGSVFTRQPPILNFDKASEVMVDTWICTSEKIQRELGWTPRFPLPVGLAQTAKWYRSRGLL